MLHLIRRFVGFVLARPLTPAEQRTVAGELTPPVAALFFAQRFEDQRHAHDIARPFVDEPELLEAALTHDVGKTATGLGAIGRSAATLWALTGLPAPATVRTYLDHGRIGADWLSKAGAGPVAVAFARFHPGPPPEGIDRSDWERLSFADGA